MALMSGNAHRAPSGALLPTCSFSAWGVTRKFLGLLLACNQILLVLVGRRWPCWGEKIHGQDLTERCVRQRASSMLKLQFSEPESSSNLVWRRWSLIQRDSCKTREWYSANKMGAGCRPGRLWRGVVPYGRSHGRLPAPARQLSQV